MSEKIRHAVGHAKSTHLCRKSADALKLTNAPFERLAAPAVEDSPSGVNDTSDL